MLHIDPCKKCSELTKCSSRSKPQSAAEEAKTTESAALSAELISTGFIMNISWISEHSFFTSAFGFIERFFPETHQTTIPETKRATNLHVQEFMSQRVLQDCTTTVLLCTTIVLLLYCYCTTTLYYYGTTTALLDYYGNITVLLLYYYCTVPGLRRGRLWRGGSVGWRQKVFKMKGFWSW